MTWLLKTIHRPCCELFHVRTIFLLHHRAEESKPSTQTQSSGGQYRAILSVAMTTVVNKRGMCGGTWGRKERREEVTKCHKYVNTYGHAQLEFGNW